MVASTLITGVGMTTFGRHTQDTVESLALSAARDALTDADVDPRSVDAVVFGNATWGAMGGQHGIRGQLALQQLGLRPVPIINVENACCSATTALQVARAYVEGGLAGTVLAIGAEVMTQAALPELLAAFEGSWNVAQREDTIALLADWGSKTPVPENAAALEGRTVFMDIYASFARDHMARFGSTPEQFAAVSAKNHQHSVHNPRAQYQKPFTVEEVLHGRAVVWPLTVPMCSPVSDGAAAAVVSRTASDPTRAVRILAQRIGHGGGWDGQDITGHVSHQTGLLAYADAGVEPGDIDVAEVHDATAVGEVQQVEHMGLVPYGEGGLAAVRGETALGGRIPVNPSGGLESRGHPIGATGLAQIFELVAQLRGEAGSRQVEGARLALAENSGGLVGVEEAAVAVTILQAPRR